MKIKNFKSKKKSLRFHAIYGRKYSDIADRKNKKLQQKIKARKMPGIQRNISFWKI